MSGNGPDRLSSETSYLSHICICPFVRGLAAMAGRAQISTGAPGCFLDNPFTGPLRALNFRPGKKEARRITGEDLTRHLDSFVPLPLAQFLRENVATRKTQSLATASLHQSSPAFVKAGRILKVRRNRMAETKKCAHPACSCIATDKQKYCSQICQDSKNMTALACHCDHPGCRG
jgi:hypothetical protein